MMFFTTMMLCPSHHDRDENMDDERDFLVSAVETAHEFEEGSGAAERALWKLASLTWWKSPANDELADRILAAEINKSEPHIAAAIEKLARKMKGGA